MTLDRKALKAKAEAALTDYVNAVRALAVLADRFDPREEKETKR